MVKRKRRVFPTQFKAKCIECDELHTVDVTGPQTYPIVSYYCPTVQARIAYPSKVGQKRLRNRIIDKNDDEIDRLLDKARRECAAPPVPDAIADIPPIPQMREVTPPPEHSRELKEVLEEIRREFGERE